MSLKFTPIVVNGPITRAIDGQAIRGAQPRDASPEREAAWRAEVDRFDAHWRLRGATHRA